MTLIFEKFLICNQKKCNKNYNRNLNIIFEYSLFFIQVKKLIYKQKYTGLNKSISTDDCPYNIKINPIALKCCSGFEGFFNIFVMDAIRESQKRKKINYDDFFIGLFYECAKCKKFYGICMECYKRNNKGKLKNEFKTAILMKLEAHFYNHKYQDVIFDNDSVEFQHDSNYGDSESDRDSESDNSESYKSKLVYKRNVVAYDTKKFNECITGPDGGMAVYYYCPSCEIRFSIIDK